MVAGRRQQHPGGGRQLIDGSGALVDADSPDLQRGRTSLRIPAIRGLLMKLTLRRSPRFGAILLACSAMVSVPAPAQQTDASAAAPAEAETARFGSWGVDLAARDLSVKPGDDFVRYATGKWLDSNEIPADQAQNGVGYDTYNRNQVRLRNIVTSAPKDSQLGAIYACCMS
jgi:hypothetical protein